MIRCSTSGWLTIYHGELVSIDPGHKLVYHEHYSEVDEAIAREKQLKRWSRTKKIGLIGRMNPRWVDLADDILGNI